MIGREQDTAIAMAGRRDGGVPVTPCIARNTRHEPLNMPGLRE